MNKYKYVDNNAVVLSRIYSVKCCNDDTRVTNKVPLGLSTVFR